MQSISLRLPIRSEKGLFSRFWLVEIWDPSPKILYSISIGAGKKQEVLELEDTILNIFDRDAVKLECKSKNLLHTIYDYDIERKII